MNSYPISPPNVHRSEVLCGQHRVVQGLEVGGLENWGLSLPSLIMKLISELLLRLKPMDILHQTRTKITHF